MKNWLVDIFQSLFDLSVWGKMILSSVIFVLMYMLFFSILGENTIEEKREGGKVTNGRNISVVLECYDSEKKLFNSAILKSGETISFDKLTGHSNQSFMITMIDKNGNECGVIYLPERKDALIY